jgi:dTDP-4-amino-4,6-dideoxygalactose transaminase
VKTGKASATERILAPPPLDGSAPWPHFEDDEIDAAAAVLRSGRVNYWTGEHGRAFESEFARHCGVEHAVAVANGSLGLEIALHAVGVGAGDDVVVPARSFMATASSVSLRGGVPVFADIDRDNQGLTAASIERVLTPRTRAVIVVHLAGWPCEMDDIVALARIHGLKIIEDCAQAHGARYHGRVVGTIGDVGVYSFCQDKIMTTGGEGGMIVTNDREVWSRAWSYKDHGKTFEAASDRRSPTHAFRWLHDTFGTNARLTEMQSAIGRIQLRKLPQWSQARRAHAARYDEVLCSVESLRVPATPAHVEHARYKHYVFVRPDRLRSGWSRDRILQESGARGIRCFAGSCSEIYLEAAYRKLGIGPRARLPVAQELGETSLMLHVHPTLSPQQVEQTADTLASLVDSATR